MLVLTVDQVASRERGDAVPRVVDRLRRSFGAAMLLGPDRTAGDEFQVVAVDAAAALALVLELTRNGAWSVGLGIGAVAVPLPATTREAAGSAFVAAREAVERAKRSPTRFALTGEGAADAEALVDLLLQQRSRRSAEGWAVADLLAAGRTQTQAARALGITPQAVSARVGAAGLRIEQRAVPALARLLASVDAGTVPA